MGSMIGAANQDAKNALDLQTQSQALNSLWAYDNANKVAIAQQQLTYLDEMQQKMHAQVSNQALMLTVSQNSVNANILSLRSSMALLFAPLYGQLLTPDPTTNLLLANIGTSWLLQTDYIDLYPSQGFFTTTTGRSDFPFAQEIAQAPDVTNLLLTGKQGKEKLWFNQRCTARDNTDATGALKNPKDPLTVQVNLQFLYTLNSKFHAGLYLGGNYHDYTASGYVDQYFQGITLTQAQAALFGPTATGAGIAQKNMNPAIVDFDEAHLAKMVVLYRKNATSSLMLGVYEYEGLGWVLQATLPTIAQLDAQHTYNIQTMLNGNQLQVQLFVDGATDATIDQTVTVTPLANQRTYGMICSGAAITWNQIAPTPTIATTARTTPSTMTSEISREQQSKLALAAASAPKFGSFNLTPLSKQSVLQGQFVYATSDTDLKKILPESAIDFVVFGTEQGQQWQLGIAPSVALQNISTARLISVINGTVYNATGNAVGHIANAWSQYQQSAVGPFSAKLSSFISSQQAKINLVLANVKFGTAWLLTIINPQALTNGQYIYTCMQTLKNSSGQPIVDPTTGKPMIDYLVCADYTPTSLKIGLSPTAKSANALFSFVTGNVYAKTATWGISAAPQSQTTSYQGQLYMQFGTYAGAHNIATTDPMYIAISAAQASYATYAASVGKPPVPSEQQVQVAAAAVATQDNFPSTPVSVLPVATVGYSAQAPSTVHLSFGAHDLDSSQQNAAGSVGYQLSSANTASSLTFSKNPANAAKT